jgi:hypothetical protein
MGNHVPGIQPGECWTLIYNTLRSEKTEHLFLANAVKHISYTVKASPVEFQVNIQPGLVIGGQVRVQKDEY